MRILFDQNIPRRLRAYLKSHEVRTAGEMGWGTVANGLLCGVFGAITGSVLAGRIAQRPLRVALLLALIVLGFQLASRRA